MPLAAPALDSLERVRTLLEERGRRLSLRVGTDLASYIARPGKMLRARFTLHLADALGVPVDPAESAACAAELVHNASLLHDDCVDGAALRRGHPTPNALFGTGVGLLLGDLALSEAFEQAYSLSPDAAWNLSRTVREMAVGELQEEFLRGSTTVSLRSYLGLAARKTGSLFAWCGRTLSALSPLPHPQAVPPRIGRLTGLLLQIADDILDFTQDPRISGKDGSQDLAGKRLSLPVVLALQDPEARSVVLEAWESPDPKLQAERVRTVLEERGSFAAAHRHADRIIKELQELGARLPMRETAPDLFSFFDAMARREF